LAEYRQKPDVEWREVFPPSAESLPTPFFCNDPQLFAQDTEVIWPESGVAVLPDARILDEHAWVVGRGDTFIGDFCYLGNSRQSRVNHIIKLHPPRHVPGCTLNLCSANAVTNFFHYVIDAVSRYDLVRRAGFTWADFDQIVLPRFRTPMTAEIDAAIGLPESKILRMGRREQIICETLVQPSFPGPVACTPPWVVNFYRSLFPPSNAASRHRKLYFPRRGNRHPANADEIDARMNAMGFEIIDPVSTPDLRTRMAEATHIVGVHGACLANLVFCAPGTRVLEIMPSEISKYYNRAFYRVLCASGEMPYGVVVGQSRRLRLSPFSPQPKAEFDLNMDELNDGVAALLAEQ
jgi:capsular polysaccharide biosynthesis protein